MTTKGSNNPFPSVLLNEVATDGSDTPTPAADYRRLFLGEDGYLHLIDSADVVTDPVDLASSGSVATDTIWDAAGDLAVGTGSNTAARLAIGAAGGVLARVNGAVAWNASTSFPTAATGDRFFRTDHGREYYYDGTRWVSMQVFSFPLWPGIGTPAGNLRSSISATATTARAGMFPVLGGSDIWLVGHQATYIVNSGGSALSGSHKWVGTVYGADTNGTTTGTVSTVNVDSGSSAVFRETYTAIGALRVAGTLFYGVDWTKTGTPGTLVQGDVLYYRIVAT